MTDHLMTMRAQAARAWAHLPDAQQADLKVALARLSDADQRIMQAALDTDAEHPQLLRWNTNRACGEFLQRTLRKLTDLGHLSKQGGENGITFPNGVRVSHDVIAHPDGRRWDIVNSGGAHPAPGAPTCLNIEPEKWRPHNVYVPQFAQIFPSDAPTNSQKHVAEMGWSWFCLLRALKDWPQEARANRDFVREHLKPEKYRVFLDLEGIVHIRGNMPDPWRDAGIDGRAPDWADDFKRTLAFAADSGVKLWCTVYGGPGHFPTMDSRRRFHDRIVSTIAGEGAWPLIDGFEPMNEVLVNEWTYEQCQQTTEDLAAKIPAGTWLAMSSPNLAHHATSSTTNEEMDEDAVRLYHGAHGNEHFGANCMTWHILRAATTKWGDPTSYSFILPELPKRNGEPFGVGSSGFSTSDPAVIGSHYARTCQAGFSDYFTFNAWNAWNGYQPPEYGPDHHHRVKMVKDIERIGEIFTVLRTIRAGGTVVVEPPSSGGGGTGGGGNGGDDMPVDRGEMMRAGEWLHAYYQSAEGLQRPEGLWLNGHPDWEGIAAWLLDVYQRERQKGRTDEQARAEVRRQIEQSEEWRRKHAA